MIYQHVLLLGVLGVLLVGTLADFIKEEEEENTWNIIQWFIRNIILFYKILINNSFQWNFTLPRTPQHQIGQGK